MDKLPEKSKSMKMNFRAKIVPKCNFDFGTKIQHKAYISDPEALKDIFLYQDALAIGFVR